MQPKSNRFFSKLLLGMLVFLGIVGVVGYFAIFSPRFANNQKFITLRNAYVSQVFKIRDWLRLPYMDNCGYFGTPVRTLKTTTERGYKYFYSIDGKLVAMDVNKQTITLECSNGNMYKVRVEIVPLADDPAWVAIKKSTYWKDAETKPPILFYPSDLARSSERDFGYSPDDIYSVVWADTREPTEILTSVANDPEASVNTDSKAVMGVLR